MNNLKHPITGAPQYLEVKVPVTTNGVLLAYDSNQQPIYKTKTLPFTAKKRLEQKNTRLPEHLRLKITVKTNQPPLPVQAINNDSTSEFAVTSQDAPAKNKGGRPSKKAQNV